MSRNSQKLIEKMEPAKGIEPPTYGLRNQCPTVLPVRNQVLTVGCTTPQTGQNTQFVHDYAPQNAPPRTAVFAAAVHARSPAQLFGISTRTLKRLQAIQLVREQRENCDQDVSFQARPFVLCGLPLRKPPRDQLTYTRRNGNLLLEITAHPRFGLPYGQDRLIPIWVATLAQKQKSRMIHFDSPTQMLDYFRLPRDGAQYRRVKAAFQRVFAATIFFGAEHEMKRQVVVDSARFHFMDRMYLWFNRSEEPMAQRDEASDNTVTLSETFYNEITAHPIPVERGVIAALAHAPGLLDFYVWIAWKSWTVEGQPARVPIFGLRGLSNQLGSTQYSVDRLFRHKIKHWLNRVRNLWPECPAQVSEDGRFLVIQSSRKSTALQPVERRVSS